MKFLLYSRYGEGAQIAQKINLEGNSCALYIHEKEYKHVFDGLAYKVDNPDSYIDDDTVLIFDMSGLGKIADAYRRSGNPVFGAGSFNDKLELDREFGYDMMNQCGIAIPEYEEFTKFESAYTFLQNAPDEKTYVFKPSGNFPTKLTYVAKDNEEMAAYMQYVERVYGKKITRFILQEFITGVVISSEFFCDGKRFLYGNHTIEDKKFMDGGLGPSTGCSGNITWLDDTEVLRKGVGKFLEIAIENQLIGQIDLNAVVDANNTVYGLEWTPRFGYDATPCFLNLLRDDFGKFFSDIARGTARKEAEIKEVYSAGVRLSIPPYPVDDVEDRAVGVPILNWESFQENLYFYEVNIQDGRLVHSGPTGIIATALGLSYDADLAFADCYDVLDEIVVPDKQYRTDMQDALVNDMLESFYESNYESK